MNVTIVMILYVAGGISISPDSTTNNILGYTGPLTSFNEDSMLNQGATLKASIKESYFYGGAPNNISANLNIEPDADGVSMLEDNVWIHMYDAKVRISQS